MTIGRSSHSRPQALEVVSTGLLLDDEDTALMWRGLMLSKALEQFLTDVAWSPNLGYLVIDMPPGTGDVQMALSRMLPQAEMVVVTTPATGRAEGGGTRRRYGPAFPYAGRGRHREHVRVHDRRRAATTRSSDPAEGPSLPTNSECPSLVRSRSIRPS